MDNQEQSDYWNGEAGQRWVLHQDILDRALHPFGAEGLRQLAPEPGARVLDIGCGAGSTVVQLAERPNRTGSVCGVDLSGPLLERARERTRGLLGVELIRGDAAVLSAPIPFDALFSRFGVMFFTDPVAAFNNLRSLLVPGAPLTFVCWQDLSKNPWLRIPLNAAFEVLPRPDQAPDPWAPGPFAFADPPRVEAILLQAGFASINVEGFCAPVTLSPDSLEGAVEFALQVGPTARLLAEASPELRDPVRTSLTTALTPFLTPEGVALEGAVWVVSARN